MLVLKILYGQKKLLTLLLPLTAAGLLVMALYEFVWFVSARKTKAEIVAVETVRMKQSAETDYVQLKVRIHNDPTSNTETIRPLHLTPEHKVGSVIPVRIREGGKVVTDNPVENFSVTFILLIALLLEIMLFIPVRYLYNKLLLDFADEEKNG